MGSLFPKKKQLSQGLLNDKNDDTYSYVHHKHNRKNNNTNDNEQFFEIIDVNKKINKNKNIVLSKYKDIKYDEDFAKSVLSENNYYRNLNGIEPLELDDYLGKLANKIAKSILLDPSCNASNLLKNSEELGIELFFSEEKLSPEKLMENWYKEIEKNNFKEQREIKGNDFSKKMWKNSKKFGIGYYNIEDDTTLKIDNNSNDESVTDNEIMKYIYVGLYLREKNKSEENKGN